MVSVIILSYNTRDLLDACLKSVYAVLGSAIEVIVFDNASSDGSSEMVHARFPKAHLIESDSNLGFAKAVNSASKKAKNDYLLFLNSDTLCKENYLKEMTEKMQTDNSIAVIGGRLLNADGSTSESYGSFYHLATVFKLLFFRKKSPQDSNTKERAVDWVSGGFMLVRKKIFEEAGGFDERFFMYLEDMELCFRLKEKGYKVLYYPRASVLHIGQGSSNRTFAIVQIYKGLLYFYKKHKPYWQYLAVRSMLTVKAYSSIIIGTLLQNNYLRTTYTQALRG